MLFNNHNTWMLYMYWSFSTTVASLPCNLPKSCEFRGKIDMSKNWFATLRLPYSFDSSTKASKFFFQKVIVIDSRTVVEIVMWNRLWLGHNFPFSWHVGYHVNQNAKLTQNTSYKSERKHGPHLCMCKRWLNCKMRSGFLSTFNIGSMWGSCADNNYLGIYMHTKCYRSSL